MAISLVDTAVPMNDTGYPIARAKHIWFDDDVTLQDKLDNKELGGGDSSVTLTQSEYDALDEQVKLEGEFYCYDSGRHFRNGIEYGKDGVQISDNETVEDKTWSSKKTSDEISEKVDKTDITTTIDSTSTDDTVPSAKAVNELNLRGTRIDQSVIDKYGTEIIKYPLGRWHIDGNDIAGKFSDIPWGTACIIDITSPIISIRNPWDNTWAYRNYKAQTIENKGTFVRQLESRGTPGVLLDTGWQELATMDNITQPIGFETSLLNQCWGYYTKSGKKISVHMKFVLSSALSDWQSISNTKLPTPSSVVIKSANEKTGVTNSVYIYTDGTMSQAGGGGMPAGTYEFDFDYTMA